MSAENIARRISEAEDFMQLPKAYKLEEWKPTVFAYENTLVSKPDGLRVLEVKKGCPLPREIAGVIFAEEGSLCDPPDDIEIVWLKKPAVWPIEAPV